MRRVVLILAFLTFSISAQVPPKAILVDELKPVPCDEFLARLDRFFAELASNPADTGLAVVRAAGKYSKSYPQWMNASIYNRRLDRSRLSIVSTSTTLGPNAIEFWRIPPGAATIPVAAVSEPARDLSKPFVFGSANAEDICPTFAPDLYANLLKQHPGSSGKIVIYGKSQSVRNAFARAFTAKLRDEFGISQKQLRVIYVDRRHPLAEAEFWFIPAKKK